LRLREKRVSWGIGLGGSADFVASLEEGDVVLGRAGRGNKRWETDRNLAGGGGGGADDGGGRVDSE